MLMDCGVAVVLILQSARIRGSAKAEEDEEESEGGSYCTKSCGFLLLLLCDDLQLVLTLLSLFPHFCLFNAAPSSKVQS